MTFPILSLWQELTSPTNVTTGFNTGDKIQYVCENEAVPTATFNITCFGALGWDVPNPLPPCLASQLQPGYIVARNNRSFNGSILQAAQVCDKELQLGLPWVASKLDMYRILANVTPLTTNGIIVPIANNIRK
jgi:hypothetical protein